MLYFTSEGSSNNQPVLFLHGFMGSGRDFTAINLPDFWKLTFDLPAHGKSILPLNSDNFFEEVCGHVLYTLDNLKVKKTHLVGYSMGGRLSLYLKKHHPNRFLKTLVFSANGGAKTKALKLIDLEKWYRNPIFDGMKNRQSVIAKRQKAPKYGLKHYLDNLNVKRQGNLWDVDADFFCGAYDKKYLSLYQKHLDRFNIIADASHAVFEDNPEECNQLINKELYEHSIERAHSI
ncbi:MAG: alpha/beta fold hydrolase [Simkaniaceae bacterium]|nr:alpha/beta fold hydrolase [Simkaniaceae bacterium]